MNILYFAVALFILAVFLIIPKKRGTKRFGIAVLSIALLLEIFVFNFHSFHILFGNYEERELDVFSASVSGGECEGDGVRSNSDGNALVFEFKDIGQPIGTLYIDCTLPDGAESKTDYVNVSIDAKDATWSAAYRSGVASGQIVNGSDRTQTVVLDLSGNVKDMRVTLKTEKGAVFTVNSIVANRAVPFELSILRLLLIVLSLMGVYALLNFPSMNAAYEDKKLLFSKLAFAMTAVMIVSSVAITFVCSYNSYGGISTGFKNTSGNQISQEIVDAFEAGQVHLLAEPSEELLALENPYDWGERSASGVSAKWDHLLFEGKYYSYYGIAPVLILFLPYHAITGYYFPSAEAIMLFGAVGMLFLTLLFTELVKRFFPRISTGIALCSLLVLQMSSGIFYCYCSPLFYEIAQSSGFMFTCAGAYFLLRSGVVGGGGISKLSLVLSSLCLSMAVLCRPTLALYCVVALIFIAFGFFKNKRMARDGGLSVVKESVKYLVSALVCFAVIGSVQMIYNYLRFGSFFDFGIQYSLTINDFTQSQYHTDLAMIGFWNFLFAFPYVKTEFPFIFSNFSDLDVNGYYFIANRNAIGLIWRALPCFGYFGAVSAWRRLDKKKRLPAALLIGTACVAAPLIIIFSIWESGYGVRYSADFAWQIIIGATCILFFHYTTWENQKERGDARRLMTVFFAASAVVAFAVNFAMIYDYLPKTGNLEASYLAFERIFDFWK